MHLLTELIAGLWLILGIELIIESAEDGISNISDLSKSGGNNQSLDENPIREVTDEIALEKKEENTREADLPRKVNEIGQNNAKRETGSRRSKAKSERPSEKIVRLLSYAGGISLIEIATMVYTVILSLSPPV